MFNSDIVDGAVPVEPQLRLPLKLPLVEDGILDEPINDVSRMHVDDDQRVHLLSVLRV